jgi:hypothetical protein
MRPLTITKREVEKGSSEREREGKARRETTGRSLDDSGGKRRISDHHHHLRTISSLP